MSKIFQSIRTFRFVQVDQMETNLKLGLERGQNDESGSFQIVQSLTLENCSTDFEIQVTKKEMIDELYF